LRDRGVWQDFEHEPRHGCVSEISGEADNPFFQAGSSRLAPLAF